MLARDDACERFGQPTEIGLARDRWMELQLPKMQQVAATEAYLMKTTNHSLKILIFMFFFSAGVTLFTARVAAQDEGWQIMRADYGFKAQRTDVTDILRDLVSRGGVNGRVAINNQTMGGDPAVGRDKSLRIFARNRRNEEREFDVNEGGFIDAVCLSCGAKIATITLQPVTTGHVRTVTVETMIEVTAVKPAI